MEFVTVKKAAELLGVSENTIRRYIRDGNLSAIQPRGKGGAIRIAWNY